MASERIFLRKSGTSATVLIEKKNRRIAIGINLKNLVNENVTSRGSLVENGVKLFPRKVQKMRRRKLTPILCGCYCDAEKMFSSSPDGESS